MLYSTLLGCSTMLLGGGLLAVGYIAPTTHGTPAGTDSPASNGSSRRPLYSAIALYWICCAVWAAFAANRSNLPSSHLRRLQLQHPSETDRQP